MTKATDSILDRLETVVSNLESTVEALLSELATSLKALRDNSSPETKEDSGQIYQRLAGIKFDLEQVESAVDDAKDDVFDIVDDCVRIEAAPDLDPREWECEATYDYLDSL